MAPQVATSMSTRNGGKAGFGVVFRVGVYRYMALVQMCQLGLTDGNHRTFGNQNGDRSALRVIILSCNVEHLCANHVGQGGQNIGQTLRIVLFIDVRDVVPLFSGRFGVADVIDVKAQRFS